MNVVIIEMVVIVIKYIICKKNENIDFKFIEYFDFYYLFDNRFIFYIKKYLLYMMFFFWYRVF